MAAPYLLEMLADPTKPIPYRPVAYPVPKPVASPVVAPLEPAAPAAYTPPAEDPLVTLINAQKAAGSRMSKALATPQAQPKAVKPVNMAFRSQDLAKGLLPLVLLLLAGKGKEAAQFGMGYVGGKDQKAAQDTQALQQQSDADAWAANEARGRELGIAQFELGQANDALDGERQRLLREAQLGDKAKGDAIRQALGLHRTATDRNAEPGYRTNAIDQALSLLGAHAGDPTVADMMRTFEGLRADAGKPSNVNSIDQIRIQREQKALSYMDQDLRDKHLTAQERIRTMRASQAMAASMGDMKWFQTYVGLYDDAIKDVDSQLSRWLELSKTTPLTEEQYNSQVLPLVEYKNQLVNEKSAIPMPNQPSAATQQGGMSIAPEGDVPPFTGQITLPPAGNVRLPLPKGGIKSAPIVSEAGAAKKKSAEEKEKARKAEAERKASEQKAKDAERSKVKQEIEKEIRSLETEKAGLDPKRDKEDLAKINAELETRRKQLSDNEPKVGGAGMADTVLGIAQTGVAAAKIAASQSKTKQASKPGSKTTAKPKASSDLRAQAIAAIKAGKDPALVKARYEKLTKKKADF